MSTLRDLAGKALSVMDRVVAERSGAREFEDVAEATRCIVAMRDHLIARRRTGETTAELRSDLNRVNQLLSMSSAAEYPLVGIHWDRMQKTRDLLREMVAEV